MLWITGMIIVAWHRAWIPGVQGGRAPWLLALLAGSLAGVLAVAPLLFTLDLTRAASQPAKSAESFIDSVGVNTHLGYFDTAYGDYPLIKDKLSTLGVRHIRDGAYLSSDPDYNRTIYDRYKDLAALGIRANLIVDPRAENLSRLYPSKLAEIASLAGDALESFEGPNEYDISGDGDWVNVLRAYQWSLYAAARSDPSTASIPVIGPSLTSREAYEALGDLSADLDYGNIHSYPGGTNPGSQVLADNMEYAKSTSGGKPLMATETGYHNVAPSPNGHRGTPEEIAGKYVPRLYLEYFNRGIPRTYVYELIDQWPKDRDGDGSDDQDPESNFGLLRNDGSEKPAYTALKNLIGLLEDPGPSFTPGSLGYSLSGDTADVRQTLLQKRDGRFYLILWQEAPGYYDPNAGREIPVPANRVTLTFDQPIQQATTYLPNVSAAPVEQQNAPEQLTLDVPDSPLVVEITPYLIS